MKFAVLRLTLCCAGVVLAACSTTLLESQKIDYKSASAVKVPSLEVPPDLTSPTRDDRFAVPDSIGKGTANYLEYLEERSPQARAQQASNVLPQIEKARIERSGNQRWLVIAGTPDKLWDQVKEFWQETGFLIKLELPEAGVMETDWAENRAKIGDDMIRSFLGRVFDSLYSTSERDKFRTRLEQGSEPGTTEIYISHRGMIEVFVSKDKDQTMWQPRESDPELEAEMLRRLMVRFGYDQKRAESQVASAKNKPAERARLKRANDGAGSLEVDEPFDRAWRRVGLALDRIGFTVEDRDRSKGLYFVRYVDPEVDAQKKSDGLLSKLAFWKGSAPPPQTRYRIYVKDNGAQASVQVLSLEGGVSQGETPNKILGLLHNQLK